jgi:uncharacterized damage-inducible protein DinB
MTFNDVKRLFDYNRWANVAIFEALAGIPADAYSRDLQSSHGGLHGTLSHLVGAEKIWLSRWVGRPEPRLIEPSEFPALRELRELWEEVDRDRDGFLGTFDDQRLQETLTMSTTSGKTFAHAYWQMFQHLVNHSSYHRGQIAGMMRQLGFQPPATDLIRFYREAGR